MYFNGTTPSQEIGVEGNTDKVKYSFVFFVFYINLNLLYKLCNYKICN
jgi:hypothetical protein